MPIREGLDIAPQRRMRIWILASLALILSSARTHACEPGLRFRACIDARTTSVLDLSKSLTLIELAPNSQEYRSPRLHHRGALHSAMYLHAVDGQPRIVKVIYKNLPNFMDDQKFQREVQSMILGSEAGGPQIFRAGRIVSASGELGYFVEMEFLGLSQNTFTLKGLKGRLIPTFQKIKQIHVSQIAKRLRLALERELYIGQDHDFLFTETDVRWIDTADWVHYYGNAAERDANSDFYVSYAHVMTVLKSISSTFGTQLPELLHLEIQNSPHWTIEEKKEVWEKVKYQLRTNYGWPERVFNTCRSQFR